MDKKKIISSAITIGAAGALLIGATFAFFSASGTSSDNTFASGTLVLNLDDANESATDNAVTTSISASNFAPGDSTSGFISLDNAGSINIPEVEFTIDTSETADPGADSDMKSVLNLTVVVDDTTTDSACTGGTNITSAVDTQVGDGSAPLTLAEFDNGGTDVYDAILSGSGDIGTADTRNVCFTVTFDSGAGNIYQGDAVSATFTFTANQDETQ